MTQKKAFTVNELTFTALSAAIITICSWISIPIGEVPITLQTFAVCLVTALLGIKCGIAAVLVYLLLGAVGAPVFAGFAGGLAKLAGPTGGYLVGFLFTALIVGFFVKKFGYKIPVLIVSMILGILVCYFFGTIWFIQVFAGRGTAFTVSEALALCVIPYLIPDAVKIVVASLLVKRIRPLLPLR